MACARCGFYEPKASAKAQALEGKANLLRLRQEIPLNDAELRAVEEGIAAHVELVAKLGNVPAPDRRSLYAGGDRFGQIANSEVHSIAGATDGRFPHTEAEDKRSGP